MSDVDAAFGNWLAGLIDGEGCFTLTHVGEYPGRPECYGCRFHLKLRDDDYPMLAEVGERTGIGYVEWLPGEAHGRRRAQARWIVLTKLDCQALVALLDVYPLRSKKARDFVVWREAVEIWCSRQRGDSWDFIANLHSRIRLVRAYPDAASGG